MKHQITRLIVGAVMVGAGVLLLSYGGEKGPVIPDEDHPAITMPFPLQRIQQLASQTNEVLRSNNYWR